MIDSITSANCFGDKYLVLESVAEIRESKWLEGFFTDTFQSNQSLLNPYGTNVLGLNGKDNTKFDIPVFVQQLNKFLLQMILFFMRVNRPIVKK
jgi:hypothetical protein